MERHYIHFETPDLAALVNDTAPPAGPEEVLIKVDHAGINRADLLQRLGLYPPPEDASPIPGLEVAGQVVVVGERCTALKVGDRVCALTHGGGYASHAIAREDHCLALPDSLSTEQGAALPEALLTVWYNVMERGQLSAGETVLIYGGSSGIGSIGIQMAAALGATVISTVGSEAKARVAQACGADHVILYREEDFVARVKEITGGRGVDVAYDSVGKDTFAGSLDCLAPLGHLVNFGQASGPVPPFEVSRLAAGSHTLLRPIIFHYLADPARRGPLFEMLLGAMEAGLVTPDVALSLPLSEAAEAHRALESRALAGAVILRP